MDADGILLPASRKTALFLDADGILQSTSRKTALFLEVATLQQLLDLHLRSGISVLASRATSPYQHSRQKLSRKSISTIFCDTSLHPARETNTFLAREASIYFAHARDANIYSTYASVAILTLHPNCSTRREAQASKVAPVVRTSSIIRAFRPLRLYFLSAASFMEKAALTLCHRS